MTLTLKVYLGVIHMHVLTKFYDHRCNTFWDMNYCPVVFVYSHGQTDRETESDAYEPTVQLAQK